MPEVESKQSWSVQWWRMTDGALRKHKTVYTTLSGAMRWAQDKSGDVGVCRESMVFDNEGVMVAEFAKGIRVKRVPNGYGGFYRKPMEETS